MKTKTKPTRFIDNGHGSVTDTKTNLIWEKRGSGDLHAWAGAVGYCSCLPHGNWRLPTIDELLSLMDERHEPTINPIFECKKYTYWSSTIKDYYPYFARVGNFVMGREHLGDTPGYNYVRAVRSGGSGRLIRRMNPGEDFWNEIEFHSNPRMKRHRKP